MSLRIEGFENLANRDKSIPHIIYANHSSWWDGLIMFQICREAKVDLFAMMEEKQVLEYPFHRKLGAFSVVRENPRDALKAVKYAADLLKEDSERCVLIFPQGELVANEKRPIIFFNGISRVIEKIENSKAIPVAIRYEFGNDWKPEILIKIDKPQGFEKGIDRKEITKLLENKLTENLDSISKSIGEKNLESYKKIFD
jgi:chlorobactene lauroyltransferase